MADQHPTPLSHTEAHDTRKLETEDITLSEPVSTINAKAPEMHRQPHSRNQSISSTMTGEKGGNSGARTRSVSFAVSVDPPASRPSSTYLSPNTAVIGPDPAYRNHRRPTLAELPERTKDNDVPARKTFVWVSMSGIGLSLIALGLSTALLVLSTAVTVMGGAIYIIVAAVFGTPLPILAMYYWRLPNAPSKYTKIFQGLQGFLWTTIFIIMCVLGGLREEEDIDAGERHKGLVELDEKTPQSVETIMIVLAILGLMGIAQTVTAFYILQRGRYQVALNNAPPNIRASMLMMQPGPAQRRGGSMSSEYPDCRPPSRLDEDDERAADVYAQAAEDYLELNKVRAKDLGV